MKGEQALVPKLRFRGFGGDWQISTIKDNLDKVIDYRGKAPPKYDYGIPLITARNVRDGYLDFTADEYIAEDQYESWMCRGIPKANDVLFTTEAPLGNVAIYPEDRYYALGQRIITLQVNSNQCDSLFLFHNLRSSKTQRNIESKSTGSTAKGIKSKVFVLLNIATPSLPEQEKIAAFLTSVDDRIDQLKRKKSLLQDYKKGAMQKLFSQELRFKNEQGKDFPDWEDKRLGEVGVFLRGISYNSTNVSVTGLFVLRSTNIQDQRLMLDRDFQFIDVECPQKISLKKGDIAICMSNGSKRLVGKSAVYDGSYPHPLTVGAFCSIFRTANCLAPFLLQTQAYSKYLHILLAGTNINNLKNSDLAELSFSIPSDSDEQTKIANFLSSLDQKIEQVDTQITQTQTFKKGLLQQMFV